MTTVALGAVAAWEPLVLRGAVSSLAAVADRLPSWRFRMEAIARSLEAPSCWSGPAAGSAAGALVELSGVVTAVCQGLDRSLAAFGVLTREAATAQELAAAALSLGAGEGAWSAPPGGDDRPPHASAGPVTAAALLSDGRSLPSGPSAPSRSDADGLPAAAGLAQAALQHAAAAATAAAGAGEELRGLGVADAFVPADFAGLVRLVGAEISAVPGIPTGAGPETVSRWWAALSEGARETVLATDPAVIGRLDGVPAWARDRANRILLGRAEDGSDGGGMATAAVAAVLERAAAAGRPVQLFAFDPAAGVVALAFGDIDRAGALALLVPGILTTVAGDLSALAHDAEDVADAARAAVPGVAVATVAWLGYRTPQRLPEIVTRGDARRGGRALDDTLAGLAAARAASATPPARTTVLAHSYGTVVVDEAADRPGRLAADAVVLLGSPGMEPDRTVGREVPEVYDAAAALDPVSWVAWFGTDTWSPAYGATELPADWDTLHWQYYDGDRPTLAAMGQVVAGTRTGR